MLQKEPASYDQFICAGFGKETYPGFCVRHNGAGAINGWWSDLTSKLSTATSKTKSDVERAAGAQASLTIWKVAALGTGAVILTLLLLRK